MEYFGWFAVICFISDGILALAKATGWRPKDVPNYRWAVTTVSAFIAAAWGAWVLA
jgi:hypothetical protein